MTSARERIRTLNDLLRRYRIGGQVVLTPGIVALGLDLLVQVDEALENFDSFTPDDDSHGEHDFGVVRVQGHRVFFKIDYFDADLRYRSPDPADPAVTRRVMTLMLAEEY